jgi:hypothetical protein
LIVTFAGAESLKRKVVPSGALRANTAVVRLETRKRLLVTLTELSDGGCRSGFGGVGTATVLNV